MEVISIMIKKSNDNGNTFITPPRDFQKICRGCGKGSVCKLVTNADARFFYSWNLSTPLHLSSMSQHLSRVPRPLGNVRAVEEFCLHAARSQVLESEMFR